MEAAQAESEATQQFLESCFECDHEDAQSCKTRLTVH